MKKGKYVYYHCTNFRGACDNTYIRQEALADRLADVIKLIQISPEVADDIATAIRASDGDTERHRTESLRQPISVAARSRRSSIGATRICSMAESQTTSGLGNRRRGRRSWRSSTDARMREAIRSDSAVAVRLGLANPKLAGDGLIGGWSGPPSLLRSYGGHPSRRQ
jgi:hypothetical protein